MKSLRLVFLGTPEFAAYSLKTLYQSEHQIVGVVTAPDKPAGRGQKLHETAVKILALELGIPILQPSNLKDEVFVEELKKLNADLQIVVAFRMLPEKVWNMPPMGTVNLHASLLPQYRGAAPINWAVINGETESGISTFLLKHEIDTGDLLKRQKVEIGKATTAGELHDILMTTGANLLVQTVDELAMQKAQPIPQAEIPVSEIKKAPKIFKDDMLIDWKQSCLQIYNLIRGLSPYPTAWTVLNDKNLKIYRSEIELIKHQHVPGTWHSDNKTYLKCATSDGYIQVKELQLEGKKKMDVIDFMRGYQLNQKV